ncbi:MAG: glycosyltransferase [bacterium]|nr:glycosyltransferase [bacterium]
MATRLLYLFPSTTHPVTNGAQVRASRLLRHFAGDLGWEVEFACPAGSRDARFWGEDARLLSAVHIPEAAPGPAGASVLGRARTAAGALAKRVRGRFRRMDAPGAAAPKPHPSLVSARMERYAGSALARHVRALLRDRAYDVVLVSYVWMSPCVEGVPGRRRRPLMILDTHDIQYVRESRLDPFRAGAPSDIAGEKALELSVMRRYDLVLAISRWDEAVLRRELPGARLCAVPVEVPLPRAGSGEPRHDLVFLGADNEANRLALLLFRERILPRLVAARPSLTVAVAGRVAQSPEIGNAFKDTGVRLEGYVPSSAAFIASGRIFIAPVAAGGGVKMKVLEAMAHGVPVVTTPVGAEGIECEAGVHCAVARDDEEFAREVLRFLDSPALRAEVAARARALMARRMSAGTVYRDLDAALAEALR